MPAKLVIEVNEDGSVNLSWSGGEMGVYASLLSTALAHGAALWVYADPSVGLDDATETLSQVVLERALHRNVEALTHMKVNVAA